MELLVVEDELRMQQLLRKGLSEDGHSVSCACNGKEGLRMAREKRFDAVILDVMLPQMDGFEVARNMRTQDIHTPVLMLTARDSVPDIVQGLEIGADDYLTKPFSFNELLLRLRAVTRRAGQHESHLEVDDLVLDRASRVVRRGEKRVSLTRTEYNLLERLMRDAGKAVLREELIASLGREVGNNTLEAFVRLLRNKIDCDSRCKLIQTVRGIGYMISVEYEA